MGRFGDSEKELMEQGYISGRVRIGIQFLENANALENAKQLLRDTSMNVLDIALQVGYEGSDQFIRAFRKHNQTTPSEYRRRYQVDRS